MTQLTKEELYAIGRAAPAFQALLKKQEEQILARLYGAFRNGEHEHLTAIAEFACIRTLINNVNDILKQLEATKEQ